MKSDGEYSTKHRVIGRRMCVAPEYIQLYMDKLDEYFIQHIYDNDNDIAIQLYFRFITIHPFSDGNGRVPKAIFRFFDNCNSPGITAKKKHNKLCKMLEKLQKKDFDLFNEKIDLRDLHSLFT